MKIGDLIHVPPVRTVIRIADLADDTLRRHLVETFVLTAEVAFSISTILEKIAATEGKGFFVIGNYGSGKSHLLNILSLAVSDEEARRVLSASYQEASSAVKNLPALLEKAASTNPLVVAISLVEHSNREYLENIVLRSIAAKLAATAPDANGNILLPDTDAQTRQEAFGKLKNILAAQGYGGLLLLIDELSEFLRSKENARVYNEDVRFLQYLGEFAEVIPAWVVATMQENIENTGALSDELLHKIKDRYPLRFLLSGEHVKEIISGRLVRQKEEASSALPPILNKLKNSFGALPFSSDDFFKLYPVHPVTVELLDELRPLFSQHRGVIDFIHYRLAGDPGRAIPSFLEKPAHELLTPDYIFDHFRDRLRETVETSPYSEQVFHYYERDAEQIFDNPEDATTALRILKLLIMGALARAPKHFTAKELTQTLLQSYSDLESAINYDYIEEIAEKMLLRGAYVTAVEKAGQAKSYTVDTRADIALLLQKKLERMTGSYAPGDPRITRGLLPWVDDRQLPLKDLLQEPLQDIEITWQNTRRKGKIFFYAPDALDEQTLGELEEELTQEETDFLFFIIPPRTGQAEERQTAASSSPLAADLPLAMREALAIWTPRAVTAEEEDLLKHTAAYLVLQEEYASDSSPVGLQMNKQLSTLLQENRNRVSVILRSLYFQGRISAGRRDDEATAHGHFTLNDVTAGAAAEVLKNRYPRHHEIAPTNSQAHSTLMQRALDYLFSPHLEKQTLESGTELVINSQLVPLGLVKKKSRSYQLEINPKTSPIVAEFLSMVPENGRIGLEKLYRKLRKGPFGLSRTSFQALAMTATLSGAVSAYQGGKRVSPNMINFHSFSRIEEIGPGTLIHPELQKTLTEVPFLSAALRTGPLTFTTQQQAWEEIITFKKDWTNRGAYLENRMERLKDHPFFSDFNWSGLSKTVSRLTAFLDHIKTSYSSQAGLEQFLAAFQGSPLIVDDWKRLVALELFFKNDLPEILRLSHYLRDKRLVIPPGDDYAELRLAYQRLLDLLEAETLLLEEKYRDQLKLEFSQFREQYCDLYLREHNRAVGPASIKAYRDLLDRQAYRLLEQCGRINTLVVKNDLVAINRLLSLPLERECRAADESVLAEQPACSCGYLLGETIDLPDRGDLEEQILESIRSYLQALQSSATRRKIEKHAERLEMVGRRREAAPLKEILNMDADLDGPVLIEALSGLLDGGAIKQINEALTGSAIIAERSAEKLLDLLADRVFNTAQLQDLFMQWLVGGETKAPEYVRVTRQEDAPLIARNGQPEESVEPGKEARLYLEEKFPRLLSAATLLRLEKIFALALIWSWLNDYCPPGKLETDGARELGRGEMPEELYKSLVVDQLEERENAFWEEHGEDCHKLGLALTSEKESLQASFLERAAATAHTYLTAEELIECYYRINPNASRHFEKMLDLLQDEPFFPAVSRLLAGRIASSIAAEERTTQLSTSGGMLHEARRAMRGEEGGLTADHREEKSADLLLLKKMADCNLILREIDKNMEKPPDKDGGWEKFYQMLAPCELLLESLDEGEARNIVPEVTVTRWRRQYRSSLDHLAQAFAAHYLEGDFARRLTLPGLFSKLPGWIDKQKEVASVFVLIIDGIRLDLWQAMLKQMFLELRFQVLREGLLWSLPPTVTATQEQALLEEGLLGHVINMNDRLLAELNADPAEFLQSVDNAAGTRSQIMDYTANGRSQAPGHASGDRSQTPGYTASGYSQPLDYTTGGRSQTAGQTSGGHAMDSSANQSLKVIKYNFVDDKIHASRDRLPVMLDELLLQSRKALQPLLRRLPANTVLLAASDHGFKTNLYRDRSNKEEPLYLHGGDTLFEVLAPWALLRKD